jgi:hypothetical protein
MRFVNHCQYQSMKSASNSGWGYRDFFRHGSRLATAGVTFFLPQTDFNFCPFRE